MASGDNQARRVAAMQKYWDDPVWRQKQADTQRTLWKSEEYREAQTIAQNKGKSTPEHRQLMADIMTTRWNDPEFREKMLKIWRSAEFREGQSKTTSALWADPDFRQQQADAQSEPLLVERRRQDMKARWADSEYRQAMEEMSAALWQDPAYRAAHVGENCHFWRDGSSAIYPPAFNEALKEAVRKRDGLRCALCGDPQGHRALCVHHIDGNKQNCDMANLISLHNSCHRAIHVYGDFDAYRVRFQALLVSNGLVGATP